MDQLHLFGWGEFQREIPNADWKPGRVIAIHGFKYTLMTEHGEKETELSGRLLYGTPPEKLPRVGDWVFFLDYESMGYVVEQLPRKNELSRKNPGNKNVKQVLAANVDGALIVQGLDRDFNIMRLERYLVQMAACGVAPTVVLNKSDLIDNQQMFREQVQRLERDCPVYCCSSMDGTGVDKLMEEILLPRKTFVLIGSSGVGKSSLLNALSKAEIQKTNTTSDANQKGRHTTTARELFQLPNGALIIDTPGMREFGVTGTDASEGELFPALAEWAAKCHYADCTHTNESGCAVLSALEEGLLAVEIYDSYIKLLKEQRRFDIKIEDRKRLGKQFGRISREAQEYRKKYKY